MSLLQILPYKDYKKALVFTTQQCEIMAKLANLNIIFNNTVNPGELLIQTLDRRGYTIQKYIQLIKTFNLTMTNTYYKPQAKIAILIANNKYLYLSKLASPWIDCDTLATKLKALGFIVVTIKDTVANEMKNILKKVFDCIPEDSYCLIFYAGHGCQLCNTKCMLTIDCPPENIQYDHCVTENFLLNGVEKCKPELCVLIMDMCRVYLDRNANPQIYSSVPSIEDYSVYKNLIIGYSAQSSEAAYEVLQIECSDTINNEITYELKTGDTDRIVLGGSQYVNALCARLNEPLDVSSMLDKVHEDVENAFKKQKPIKLQCGVDKRSLYDPVSGDTTLLLAKFKEVFNGYSEKCSVF